MSLTIKYVQNVVYLHENTYDLRDRHRISKDESPNPAPLRFNNKFIFILVFILTIQKNS